MYKMIISSSKQRITEQLIELGSGRRNSDNCITKKSRRRTKYFGNHLKWEKYKKQIEDDIQQLNK